MLIAQRLDLNDQLTKKLYLEGIERISDVLIATEIREKKRQSTNWGHFHGNMNTNDEAVSKMIFFYIFSIELDRKISDEASNTKNKMKMLRSKWNGFEGKNNIDQFRSVMKEEKSNIEEIMSMKNEIIDGLRTEIDRIYKENSVVSKAQVIYLKILIF